MTIKNKKQICNNWLKEIVKRNLIIILDGIVMTSKTFIEIYGEEFLKYGELSHKKK